MNIITSENTFASSTDHLLQKFDKSITYKLKYFINTIFEIIIKSEKICNFNTDLIPKLLAYENSELYTEFLNMSSDNYDCIKLYKTHVGEEYDEFLFISISFIYYIVEVTESEQFVVLNVDNDTKKIKILTKLVIEKLKQLNINPFNVDLDEQEYNGSINLNITIH